MKSIRRFVDHYEEMPSDFDLSLKAGSVNKDGDVINGQLGAIDTFCVGMPMYSENGEMLGRLELTLYEGLDYASRTKEGLRIPVEYWRIKGYNGQNQTVLTYYQAKAKGLLKQGE